MTAIQGGEWGDSFMVPALQDNEKQFFNIYDPAHYPGDKSEVGRFGAYVLLSEVPLEVRGLVYTHRIDRPHRTWAKATRRPLVKVERSAGTWLAGTSDPVGELVARLQRLGACNMRRDLVFRDCRVVLEVQPYHFNVCTHHVHHVGLSLLLKSVHITKWGEPLA